MMDSRELNVAQHAVAFPKFNRNIFHATRGTRNHSTWHSLEYKGYAECIDEQETKLLFKLTAKGIEYLQSWMVRPKR